MGHNNVKEDEKIKDMQSDPDYSQSKVNIHDWSKFQADTIIEYTQPAKSSLMKVNKMTLEQHLGTLLLCYFSDFQ